MDGDQGPVRQPAAERTRQTGRRWAAALPALACAVRDLVYPPVCPCCGVIVARHGAVCASCWPQLAFIERPYCPVMGTPFAHDMGEAIVSAAAIADPPPFERARAAVL